MKRVTVVFDSLIAAGRPEPLMNQIREAILKELYRGGQVYFVHDRVHNIEGVAEEIRKHVPEPDAWHAAKAGAKGVKVSTPVGLICGWVENSAALSFAEIVKLWIFV